MNPVLPGIVLLLLHNGLRCLAPRVGGLLVDPDPLAVEHSLLGGFLYKLAGGLLGPGLLVVQGRREVYLYVRVDDADGLVLVFGFDFQDVDFEFARECAYGYSVALVQAGEVSELEL